jgi:twinkle protein
MELIRSTSIDFAKYLEGISILEAETIKSPAEFLGDIAGYFENGGMSHGYLLPWERTHEIIQLAPGEVTIWGGESESGKSQIAGQVVLWALHNQRGLIASLEMKPMHTIVRMAAQASGCAPSREFVEHFCRWSDKKLWIYDQLDSVAPEKLLGMVHYAAVEMGIHHIVIDSLMKCGMRKDDYSRQAEFVDRLQWASKRYNTHIHLIAHMRKPAPGSKGGKHEIRGAGEVTDLADNVLVLRRNFDKESAQEKLDKGHPLNEKETDLLKMPDSFLEVAKNRKNGQHKVFGLWFDKKSNQFVANDNRRPMHFDCGFSSNKKPAVVAPGWEIYNEESGA